MTVPLGRPSSRPAPAARVVRMDVESVVEPRGLTVTRPGLGWAMESDSAFEPVTCRVRVASSGAAFAGEGVDLWDSGWVEVPPGPLLYGGQALVSRQQCFWQVSVRGNDATTEVRSPIGSWEMGLLDPGDWTAEWIGLVRPTYSSDDHRPCPLLRRSFELGAEVARARLWVTSAGIHELFLNGERVGDRRFRPGYTDYRRRLYVDCHDVTAQLRPGRNTLGALLADGWFSGYIGFERRRELYGRQLALRAQLEVELTDGSRVVLASDASWEGCFGPVLASDFYNGEYYDARREIPGWSQGAAGEEWRAVRVVPGPSGLLCGAVYPPVRATEELVPVRLEQRPNGDIRIDFGRLFAGVPRIELSGERGRLVRLAFAEGIDSTGELYRENLWQARSTDTLVLEDRPLVWEPSLLYHGFRYVDVTGLRASGDLRSVRAKAVNTDVRWTGAFECSEPRLNQLSRMIAETFRSNLVEVMTGASQRDERIGWTGDAAAFLPTAVYLADMRGFMAKWLDDMLDAQADDGSFPSTAPAYEQLPRPFRREGWPDLFGPIAGWSDAAVRMPWETYLNYGDARVLARHLQSMVRWVGFVLKEWPDFIWRPGPHWLFSDFQQYGPETPRELFSSAFLANAIDTTARAAAALGEAAVAERHAVLFAEARRRFATEFIAADGAMPGDTQSGYVLALALDLVPAPLRPAVLGRLVGVMERDGHLRTGMHGTRYALALLAESGQARLATALALSERYPSFMQWIKLGLTMIPERWDSIRADGSYTQDAGNSLNQYALGCIGEWLYGAVGGLRPAAPGWRVVRIDPRPGPQIDSARIRVGTVAGDVSCEWRREGGGLRVRATLPPGVLGVAGAPGREVRLGAGSHEVSLPDTESLE
jgi:alpha-L-rhamnosidase